MIMNLKHKVNNNLTEDQIDLCCIPVKLRHQLEAWMYNLRWAGLNLISLCLLTAAECACGKGLLSHNSYVKIITFKPNDYKEINSFSCKTFSPKRTFWSYISFRTYLLVVHCRQVYIIYTSSRGLFNNINWAWGE